MATDFEVRAWAKAHGYQLSDAADIPDALRATFEEAQSQNPDSARDWDNVERAIAQTREHSTPLPSQPAWSEPQSPWEEQPVRPGSWDGYSIAALACGIIPVAAGLLGIALGAIGISRTKNGLQRGRTLAVIGLVLGSIWFMGAAVELALVL